MSELNRITECFNALKAEGRRALIAYIVNGDPSQEVTLAAMERLVDSGVDIIELGVPFSDPMAEGPVIQKAHERALENNVSLRDTMHLVQTFREKNQNTPVVLMGYANPVERMGYASFAEAASKAGVDGLLTVDLPPEEATELNQELKVKGLEMIFLLAPTSSKERVKKVVDLAGGFIYYVSLKGVTGASNIDVAGVQQKLAEIRTETSLPIAVGFGIKDAQSAKAIGEHAEGVVVGSALVNIIAEGGDPAKLLDGLQSLGNSIRTALDEIK